jgi:hypothetical protein
MPHCSIRETAKHGSAGGVAEGRTCRTRTLVDAGTVDVAVLDVPASAQRDRVFDISVHFVVHAPAPLAGAWHEMTVELNGRRQWSRQLDTNNPGETDTLDYHCRRDVPRAGIAGTRHHACTVRFVRA